MRRLAHAVGIELGNHAVIIASRKSESEPLGVCLALPPVERTGR